MNWIDRLFLLMCFSIIVLAMGTGFDHMSVKITEMIAALNDAITAMQSRVDDRMLLLEANIDSKTKDIDVLKQELANPAINQPDDPATISSLQTLTDSVNNYLPAGG